MTAGASSPFCSSSAAFSALVDSASPGRNEVDSFSSASVNLPGRLVPKAKKMPTSHTASTIHFARGPPGMAKIEERGDGWDPPGPGEVHCGVLPLSAGPNGADNAPNAFT